MNSKKEVSDVAVSGISPEMQKMFSESAKVGAQNLQNELPLLKIHSTGRSNNNILVSGEEPKDGSFYYKQTRQEYEFVNAHILTISKGFRAEGLNDKKDVFNQIMGGCIIEDDGTFKPFIMYFTGLKLSNLWSFGKEVSKYTHAKPFPIPMFALTVRLTTEKVVNSYGKSWIVNFEILRDKDGSPECVNDAQDFIYLRDSVEAVEDTIASLISAKANKEEEVLEGVEADPEEIESLVNQASIESESTSKSE